MLNKYLVGVCTTYSYTVYSFCAPNIVVSSSILKPKYALLLFRLRMVSQLFVGMQGFHIYTRNKKMLLSIVGLLFY